MYYFTNPKEVTKSEHNILNQNTAVRICEGLLYVYNESKTN